jgi:hypothetical protein
VQEITKPAQPGASDIRFKSTIMNQSKDKKLIPMMCIDNVKLSEINQEHIIADKLGSGILVWYAIQL